MADEVQYGTDSLTNKRKYEDQTTPPRRATGFSDQPDSGDLPPPTNYNYNYNSIPSPVSNFEIAKQRAQEIAARFLTEAKQPRVENGGSGFDSVDNVVQKPMISNMAPSSIHVLYGGYPGASKKIEIPNSRVGVIIGKAGETIKYLQLQSGAKIQVTRDMEADLNCPTRPVELTGTLEQIATAEQLIQEVLSEVEAGGSGLLNRRVPGQQSGEQYVTNIPNNKAGLVIGKGGETIKNMQATSGACIQVIPLHLPPGDTSTERTLQIDETSEQRFKRLSL